MFFGVTSARSSAGSCMRRQRLRRAMATARLASSWPMMWRLSSWTISRGGMDMMKMVLGQMSQRGKAPSPGRGARTAESVGQVLLLDGQVVVGEHADVASDVQGGLGDFTGREVGLVQQGAGSGLGVGAAGAH